MTEEEWGASLWHGMTDTELVDELFATIWMIGDYLDGPFEMTDARSLTPVGAIARIVHNTGLMEKARKAEADKADVWFFGPIGRAGHYWWETEHKTMKSRSLAGPEGFPWPGIDGVFTNKDDKTQSVWTITQEHGWTVVAFHDYTVDNRGGSNANFVVNATVGYGQAIDLARDKFPGIVERLRYDRV